MPKKNKEEKFENKPLMNSQVELLAIKIQAINQIVSVMRQRQADLQNSINLIALELGVPENQLGEWGLSQDGKTLLRVGKNQKPWFKTVKKQKENKEINGG